MCRRHGRSPCLRLYSVPAGAFVASGALAALFKFLCVFITAVPTKKLFVWGDWCECVCLLIILHLF